MPRENHSLLIFVAILEQIWLVFLGSITLELNSELYIEWQNIEHHANVSYRYIMKLFNTVDNIILVQKPPKLFVSIVYF